MNSNRNKSELAQLLQQIDMQHESAYLGLHGLASGSSQHEIINAKMERWGLIQEKLTPIVGKEAAIKIVLDVMEMEGIG
jgi:hypothetical protein